MPSDRSPKTRITSISTTQPGTQSHRRMSKTSGSCQPGTTGCGRPGATTPNATQDVVGARVSPQSSQLSADEALQGYWVQRQSVTVFVAVVDGAPCTLCPPWFCHDRRFVTKTAAGNPTAVNRATES